MDANALLGELRGWILTHAHRGELPIPGLQLAMATTTSAPASSIARPVLAVVAQGTKRLTFNDRVYTYGAGDYLVVALDVPVTGHYTEASQGRPALGIGLELRPDVIALLLLEQAAGQEPSPAWTARGIDPIATDRATDALLDAVVRLVRLLDHPADVPVLAPLIEREIAWRLLTGRHGAAIRQIGLAGSSFSAIGRAIRWIREHPAEPFRIEDLATQAHMSVSSFHRHFRAVTTLSPVQFQKKVRLQQARLLLLAEGSDVAGAGFAVGYESPSQFSREYRREFGVPPGQDATLLRGRQATEPLLSLP